MSFLSVLPLVSADIDESLILVRSPFPPNPWPKSGYPVPTLNGTPNPPRKCGLELLSYQLLSKFTARIIKFKNPTNFYMKIDFILMNCQSVQWNIIFKFW